LGQLGIEGERAVILISIIKKTHVGHTATEMEIIALALTSNTSGLKTLLSIHNEVRDINNNNNNIPTNNK